MSDTTTSSTDASALQSSEGQEQVEEKLTPGRLIVGILLRPRQTFTRLREAPKGYWLIVLLITILAVALLAFATVYPQQQRFSNYTPPEGMELPEGVSEQDFTQPSVGLQVIGVAIAGGVGVVLSYLLCAFIVFSMSFILGGKVTFKQVFRVSVWSTLPLILRRLIQAVAALVAGGTPAPGLTAVMTIQEAASLPAVYNLLSNFDVYLVWSLVLLGIGVSVTSRLSKSKSAIVVIAYVVVGVLIVLGLAAISGFLGGLTGGSSTGMRLGGVGGGIGAGGPRR